MPVWAWRRRPTKFFGEVWVPFAQVEFCTPNGGFQAFALQIDSGAIITLLRKSVAELLGIEAEAGRRIELSGVGGAHTVAHVHSIDARFGEGFVVPGVPCAIAESESVPNLLGRLGIFDRLQVDFDASLNETRVSAPWLDAGMQRIWRFCLDVEKHILQRWEQIQLGQQSQRVAARLLTRAAQLVATAAGMMKLHRNTEALLIIRTFFELSAQFEYLMQDPDKLSEQFEDFGKVTKYKQMQAMLSQPKGFFGPHLAQSAKRQAGEPQVTADYQGVRQRFLRNGNREWDKWYCMSLKKLTQVLKRSSTYDWEAEYEFWYAWGSSWAHADPFAIAQVAVDGGFGENTLLLCFHYYSRMLLLVSKDFVLTAEQYAFLKENAQDFI